MPFYVLKLGGSLMATARDLVRSLHSLEGYSFLVVPGGGPMADLVREIYARGSLSQEAAHWMAVLAMEQYAFFLADGTGAAMTAEIRPHPCGICRGGMQNKGAMETAVRILLPYQALRRDDLGIEHNWEYTSDAVAALVAAKLSTPLIKATDVDGIFDGSAVEPEHCGARHIGGRPVPEIAAADLLGVESCLDQGTVRLLCSRLRGTSLWILNGSDPESFISSLRSGEGGTVVKG